MAFAHIAFSSASSIHCTLCSILFSVTSLSASTELPLDADRDASGLVWARASLLTISCIALCEKHLLLQCQPPLPCHQFNLPSEIILSRADLKHKMVHSCRKLMYHTPFLTNYTALTETGSDWVVQHGIKFVGIDYVSIATYEELTAAHQSLMRVVI